MKRPPSHLVLIEMFVGVIDCGGFAAAGQRLNLPGEAVDEGVALLEEHLGTRLLTRAASGPRATDAGLRHVERCRLILRGIDEAFATAASAGGGS